MSDFDRLHPSLQHHIVNSLGWATLRPLQERAIAPILEGTNCLLLAPTAGGKTEAGVFPVLSRMLSAGWNGLSVIYVCPIRALLNNLHERLSFYCGLVGRTCGLWHGDVAQTVKSRTLKDPPDLLLTTPESIEALLISRRTDRQFFFGALQVVIVDEIHAFAGDDRGWHLMAVLERVQRLAGHDLQRIGLSATVGNGEQLLKWLGGSSARQRELIAPEGAHASDADVAIDYVANIENAARVLKLLHRGEKRLVFCDSRAGTEQLATRLRALGVCTFVSHSSLSVEQRRDAEAAFREGRDCVIVATSTLELGIDVGDLDRVIQIDAPSTVASFLQRLGRTGRRAGVKRNCLFLTTSRMSLLHAAALTRLWQQGFVEPLAPPPLPLHVLAQQIMVLVLQSSPVGRKELCASLAPFLKRAGIDKDRWEAVFSYMLAEQILFEDGGVLAIGPRAEKLYGAKNFMALLSIFDTPPLFNVMFGARDLGAVDPISFRPNGSDSVILSLGGHAWKVIQIDNRNRTAEVVPSDQPGSSRWMGESRTLSSKICGAIREVLLDDAMPHNWSKRAATEILQARDEADHVDRDGLVLCADHERDRSTWWTFAGLVANSQIASMVTGRTLRFDNFSIAFSGTRWPEHTSQCDAPDRRFDDRQRQGIKFVECLPESQVEDMLAARWTDDASVRTSMAAHRLVRAV